MTAGKPSGDSGQTDPNDVNPLAHKIAPLGRLGTEAEMAQSILLLISNGYVNGSVLIVDGGRKIDRKLSN